jgi:hypothetical protein
MSWDSMLAQVSLALKLADCIKAKGVSADGNSLLKHMQEPCKL